MRNYRSSALLAFQIALGTAFSLPVAKHSFSLPDSVASFFDPVESSCGLKDGGFAVVSARYHNSRKFVVIGNFDSTGALRWIKEIKDANMHMSPTSVLQAKDGGLVIIGGSGYGPVVGVNSLIIKTDQRGNVEFRKTYGYEWGEIHAVTEARDSGFVLAGEARHGGLVKIDKKGNTLWRRDFKDYASSSCKEVKTTPDGGFIAACEAYSLEYPDEPNPVVLVRTDSLGKMLWHRKFSSVNSNSYVEDLQLTDGGGFMLAGRTGSYQTGNWDATMLETDGSGATLRRWDFGSLASDENGFSIRHMDHGWFLSGTIKSETAPKYVWLKIDAEGKVVWEGYSADWFGQESSAIIPLAPGRFVVCPHHNCTLFEDEEYLQR